MGKKLRVEDEFSWLCGVQIQNAWIVRILAVSELLIALATMSQHIYSMVVYGEILHCPVVNGTYSNVNGSVFLRYDITVFDFG